MDGGGKSAAPKEEEATKNDMNGKKLSGMKIIIAVIM